MPSTNPAERHLYEEMAAALKLRIPAVHTSLQKELPATAAC